MVTETCANCGKKVTWGPVFAKRNDKTRTCPFCKKDFDQKLHDVFNLSGFIAPKTTKKR